MDIFEDAGRETVGTSTYDAVGSLAKLIYDLAGRVACWQLDKHDDVHVGELQCAVEHIKLAAKHFLLANDRRTTP